VGLESAWPHWEAIFNDFLKVISVNVSEWAFEFIGENPGKVVKMASEMMREAADIAAKPPSADRGWVNSADQERERYSGCMLDDVRGFMLGKGFGKVVRAVSRLWSGVVLNETCENLPQSAASIFSKPSSIRARGQPKLNRIQPGQPK